MFTSSIGNQIPIAHMDQSSQPSWGVQLAKAVVLAASTMGLGWLTSRIWRGGSAETKDFSEAVTVYEKKGVSECSLQMASPYTLESPFTQPEQPSLFTRMGIVYGNSNPSSITKEEETQKVQKRPLQQAGVLSSIFDSMGSVTSIWDSDFDVFPSLTWLSQAEPFLTSLAISYGAMRSGALRFPMGGLGLFAAFSAKIASAATCFTQYPLAGTAQAGSASVTFSPNGNYLVVSVCSNILIFNVNSGKLTQSYLSPAYTNNVLSRGVAYTPDGAYLGVNWVNFSTSPSTLGVTIFNVNNGQLTGGVWYSTSSPGDVPSNIAISANGLYLALSGYRGVTMFNIGAGGVLSGDYFYAFPAAPNNNGAQVGGVEFSPDSAYLAAPLDHTAGIANDLAIYKVESGAFLGVGVSYAMPTNYYSGALISPLAFSPDGSLLAVAVSNGNGGAATLFNFDKVTGVLSTGVPYPLPNLINAYSLAFSPNGLYLAVVGETASLSNVGYLTIFDVSQGTLTGAVPYSFPLTILGACFNDYFSVTFSPDNSLIAVTYSGAPNITIFSSSCLGLNTSFSSPSSIGSSTMATSGASTPFQSGTMVPTQTTPTNTPTIITNKAATLLLGWKLMVAGTGIAAL